MMDDLPSSSDGSSGTALDDPRFASSAESAFASKGDRTRSAILDQATSIASRLGLEGLTIGTLADATGMSKSGLFAHFGSREELQLAVLVHGAQRFAENVAAPAFTVARGLPRLRSIFERWMEWTGAAGLPGGCILLAAAHEYDDRPGTIRDAVADTQRRGLAMLEKAVELAIEEGHLRADTDVQQLVFEIFGNLLVFHHHRRLLGDTAARQRALAAFDEQVARYAAAPARRPSSKSPGKPAGKPAGKAARSSVVKPHKK
jgi:AcrR family transcriptional regulator